MWNKNKYFKVCAKCHTKLPATIEYFFYKKCKTVLKNGEIRYSHGLRHVCKKCHNEIVKGKRIKKRCLELGCSKQEYTQAWKQEMADKKTKFPELMALPKLQRIYIQRAYLESGQLLSPEQYKEYAILGRKKGHLNQRRHDYGEVDKVTYQLQNKMFLSKMTDAKIALILGHSVKDIPKEFIESKRALIMLKREAGLTHSTKK